MTPSEDDMNRLDRLSTAFLVACAIGLPLQAHAQANVVSYNGRCDASAAAALDANHFIVANDERNKLQIYRRGQPNPIGPGLDLSAFLGTKVDKESDLEGAATMGNRIYWISSHGRNKDAEFQDRRHRFFATDIQAGETPSVKVVGDKPYVKLLDDMLADERLKPLLAAAATLAPEAPGGLNIEGLAATPDGKLLIGFRNPIPPDGALVIALENPKDVVEGKTAKFGAPMRLKGLNGNGIRSIDLVGTSYLVVAGPPADAGSFALHRWSGKADETATQIAGIDFQNLRPEAMFAVSQDTVQIVSDDGGVMVDGKECKKLDEAKQTFRTLLIKP
jgi:hypothetical protein